MTEETIKPGLQFEARVQELAKKYKTIDQIFRHMTLGQVARYYEKDHCIFFKDGTKVYDERTGGIFDYTPPVNGATSVTER